MADREALDPPAAVERVNVALLAETAAAIAALQRRTGRKKVDLVNRALLIYEFVDREQAAGNKILVRDQNGVDQLVKFVF